MSSTTVPPPSLEKVASAAPAIDLTQLSVDEREKAWFQHYYQGDHVPQLTLRAVLVGGFLGMAMSISNLYTTLKLGWAFGVAITACVLSYAIWNSFVAVGLARTKMSILENNCMQSTASAAGYSTGGTVATAVGAMLLITGDAGRLGWLPVGLWVLLVALLGVFMAIPMKRQMINVEQLPFPSGIAAAETLRSLYAEGREAVQKARALITSLFVGGGVGIARSLGWITDHVNFPGTVATVRGTTVSAAQMQMYFEPSLLLIAAGMIVGLRVSASMMAAAVVNWVFVVPYIMGLPDWSEAGKTFFGHMEVATGEGGAIAAVKVTRWSLWLGTSLMVASGLTSFAFGWRTIVRAFTGFGRREVGSTEQAMAAIEVPGRWMVIGLVPITLALVVVCWVAFGIAPWLGLVSVAMSFALSLVACRATGETDTTPIGAMGKITQLLYAVLAPADKTVNLMTAGVTAGAAGSSADLLTDLKSGYLLGANPRKQFLAQFIGVFFGVIAVVPAWYLMVPDKAALEAFNSPATTMWHAVAMALATGVQTIPLSARWAIVAGGLIGIGLPILESLFPRARRYMPSAMGMGLALVVPFANSLSFFIGAVIATVWMRAHKVTGDRFIIPIASGAVAGESLAAAAFAIMNNVGLVG